MVPSCTRAIAIFQKGHLRIDVRYAKAFEHLCEWGGGGIGRPVLSRWMKV